MNLTKAAVVSSIMTVMLFAADLYFTFSAISILYVCFVFFALLTNDERFIIGSTIVSTLLIATGWAYHHETALMYDNIVRLLSAIVVWGAGLLSIQRKQVEQRFKLLNETLELRVMARTAAAEEKSRRLEQQIKTLQGIRFAGTRNALSQLDSVISNLKELSRVDYE